MKGKLGTPRLRTIENIHGVVISACLNVEKVDPAYVIPSSFECHVYAVQLEASNKFVNATHMHSAKPRNGVACIT